MSTLVQFVLRRPLAVIILWAALLTAVTPFALHLSGVLRGSTDAVPGSPSELVAQDVNRSFGDGAAYVFPAVLVSKSISATDLRFAAAATTIESVLNAAGMHRVRHYWNTGDARLLGRDGHTALLLVTPPAGTFFEAESNVSRIRSVIADAGLGDSFETKLTGMVSLFHDLDVNSSDDLLKAERVGIPLTLVILLFVFGAPIAAGLPLLLALGATGVALALLYALSGFMPVSVFAENAVTMVGLGVGVDYALFLISRCRQELARGVQFRTAVETATMEAGRAVLVSGLAVCIGFLALFLAHIPFLHTLALGGVTVVLTAVLATLTLLPAVLLLIGERVNWPRHPKLQSRTATLWSRWAHAAMAKPIRYLIPTLIVLAALIVPTQRLTPWNMGARDLSPGMEAREGYELLEQNFSAGWMGPIGMLITCREGETLWAPEHQTAIASLGAQLASDPRLSTTGGFPSLLALLGPMGATIHATPDLPPVLRQEAANVLSADDRTALVFVVPRSAPETKEVMQMVRELRSSPWTEARDAGLEVRIGGFSASILDFDDELFGSLRRVVPVVLVITFLVLAFTFRSIAIPLKAITMNLISVLASYGFLVYLFQDGVGASLIGLVPPGGLNSFIVLMLFTILFGLSMDYEVFLLSSIREEYERTGDNRKAVANGLARTGGVITSAALIMVVLFGSFGFTNLTATREFGLGLAFAVALDATLIRVVLVPIFMSLMGRANWWFPSGLRRRTRNLC
ncbi:MAG: MMPL family transporter [Ignavibacteriales bacterium]|nr:MMPL family transporter [Ignavibacteriales bacterium]